MQQRLASVLNPPLAFAHRGARSMVRENTLEAFGLALRLGANGLETDAWMTSDGHVVLDHDGVIRRRGRKVQISELSIDQLPAHIPRLGDLFEELGTDYDLSIDMKDDSTFAAILAMADQSGFDRSRLWLCHTDLLVLEQMRSQESSVRLVESRRLRTIKESLETHCAMLAMKRIDVLNMPVTDWTGGTTTMVHRFGLLAFGWDAQLARTMSDGLRMGLDGIYSDHVDTLVDVYTAEVGHQPRR